VENKNNNMAAIEMKIAANWRKKLHPGNSQESRKNMASPAPAAL